MRNHRFNSRLCFADRPRGIGMYRNRLRQRFSQDSRGLVPAIYCGRSQAPSGAASWGGPRFFAPAPWNSRICAAKAMPLADNFLQKQQKQRERLWDLTPCRAQGFGRAKIRCGLSTILPSRATVPPWGLAVNTAATFRAQASSSLVAEKALLMTESCAG